MTMRAVCDAWIADLTTHVAELQGATTHRYATWSLEQFVAQAGERHLAVWPEPHPIEVSPFTTGQVGSDYVTTSYGCAIWEDASTETARMADDDAANGAWLDLAEEVQARFRVQANMGFGQTNGLTRIAGLRWGVQGTVRWMVVAFTAEQPVAFT